MLTKTSHSIIPQKEEKKNIKFSRMSVCPKSNKRSVLQGHHHHAKNFMNFIGYEIKLKKLCKFNIVHCGDRRPLQSHKPDPFPHKKREVGPACKTRVAIGHNVKYQVPCFHSSAFCSHSCPALYHIEVAFCKIQCLPSRDHTDIVHCVENLPTRSTPTKSTSHGSTPTR